MGRIFLAALIVLFFDLWAPMQKAATAVLRGGPACQIHPEYGSLPGNQLSGYQCFSHVLYHSIIDAKPTPLLIQPIYPLLLELGWIVLHVLLPLFLIGVGMVAFSLLKTRIYELLEAMGVVNYHSEELKRLY